MGVTLTRRPRPEHSAALLVHAALAAVAIAFAWTHGRSPALGNAAWLPLDLARAHLASLVGGVLLGVATIALTRALVRRCAWTRALRDELRVGTMTDGRGAWLVASVFVAASEELFFRGLGVTSVGLVLSSVLFGLLHGLGGPGRLPWALWATVMGFAFGALFLATGSLLGPVVAHASINIANTRLVRETSGRRQRELGGLLGRA